MNDSILAMHNGTVVGSATLIPETTGFVSKLWNLVNTWQMAVTVFLTLMVYDQSMFFQCPRSTATDY